MLANSILLLCFGKYVTDSVADTTPGNQDGVSLRVHFELVILYTCVVARVVVAVVVLEQFLTDEAVVVVVGVGGRGSSCCGCRRVVQVGVVLGRHS